MSLCFDWEVFGNVNTSMTRHATASLRMLTPGLITPASAECRTSDITLAEVKTRMGKMDAFNLLAKTPPEFMGGTSRFRPELYTASTSGHLLTHTGGRARPSPRAGRAGTAGPPDA
jgi:hypothetical protein